MSNGKDPAVLFYTSDFLTGTMTMTNEEVGKYIRLLCLQHQKGRLTEQDMLFICNTYVENVYSKFKKNGDGLYYNERLEQETIKRKAYSESRRKNISKRYEPTYVVHMENENENINENINEDIIDNETEIVFNSWNSFAEMNNLTKIVKLTAKRIANIKNRLKEKDFDFDEILQRISESDFLLGKKTDWKIDFDFIFGSKNNWIKILEGKYGASKSSVGVTDEQLRAIVKRHQERN